MLWWPVLALIGFLALVAVVVALGTMSTNRYEQEQRKRARSTRPARTPSPGARTTGMRRADDDDVRAVHAEQETPGTGPPS